MGADCASLMALAARPALVLKVRSERDKGKPELDPDAIAQMAARPTSRLLSDLTKVSSSSWRALCQFDAQPND
jgi:hypothetical protein